MRAKQSQNLLHTRGRQREGRKQTAARGSARACAHMRPKDAPTQSNDPKMHQHNQTSNAPSRALDTKSTPSFVVMCSITCVCICVCVHVCVRVALAHRAQLPPAASGPYRRSWSAPVWPHIHIHALALTEHTKIGDNLQHAPTHTDALMCTHTGAQPNMIYHTSLTHLASRSKTSEHGSVLSP